VIFLLLRLFCGKIKQIHEILFFQRIILPLRVKFIQQKIMKKHFGLFLAISAIIAVFNSCKDEPIDPRIDEGVEINGVRWATRNLSARGTFVNNPQDLGALFQWGRLADGHERRTSETTTTLSTSDVPEYGDFIIAPESPQDWRMPQNNALWNAGTENSPVKTASDPCPRGWRIPTHAELVSLANSGSEWTTVSGVAGRRFGTAPNTIFLPVAGWRSDIGTIAGVGSGGNYWSSSVRETLARSISFSGNNVDANSHNFRVNGLAIRCVAE